MGNKNLIEKDPEYSDNVIEKAEDETVNRSKSRQRVYKICLIGDCKVGKTTLSQCFVNKNFDERYKPTFGLELFILRDNINNEKIQIWDTSGNKKYLNMINCYIRGTSCIIYIFDLSNRISFESLENWLKDVIIDKTAHCFLIGNKSDKCRDICVDEINTFANKYNLIYFEVCCRKYNNVDQIFNLIKDLSDPIQ